MYVLLVPSSYESPIEYSIIVVEEINRPKIQGNISDLIYYDMIFPYFMSLPETNSADDFIKVHLEIDNPGEAEIGTYFSFDGRINLCTCENYVFILEGSFHLLQYLCDLGSIGSPSVIFSAIFVHSSQMNLSLESLAYCYRNEHLSPSFFDLEHGEDFDLQSANLNSMLDFA